jgi:hypothetical protein
MHVISKGFKFTVSYEPVAIVIWVKRTIIGETVILMWGWWVNHVYPFCDPPLKKIKRGWSVL